MHEIYRTLLRFIPAESGCVRLNGWTAASLSADQSGQSDGGWALWEQLLMEGSMLTLMVVWWRGTTVDTEAPMSTFGPIWLPSAWIACLQCDCCVFVLSSLTLFVILPLFNMFVSLSFLSGSDCYFFLFPFLTLSLILCKPLYFFLSLFFLLCHSDSSFSAAFAQSSCSPPRKSCIMMFLTLFQFIHPSLSISAL